MAKNSLILLWTALVASGCGSLAGPSSGDGGRPPVPFDAGILFPRPFPPAVDGGLALKQACPELSGRRCDFYQRCGLLDSGPRALRECLAYFSATWCGASRWPSRVEAHTLRYDPLRAAACAEGYSSRACSDWRTEPAACGRFLSPNAYLGQPCYGLYPECREGVCRGAGCPHSCQTLGGNAEPCDDDGDCSADGGFYCRPGTHSTGVGQCTAYSNFGASCDVDRRCADPYFCTNLGQCELRRNPGQGCLDGTCVDTAWCHYTVSDGGICSPRQPAESGCTDDIQCGEGLLCESIAGRCRARDADPDGGLCSLRQSCGEALSCGGATATSLGHCQTPRRAGEACLSSPDCAPELACAPATPGGPELCQPRLPDGAPCQVSRDCQVFSRCLGNSCAPLPLPGSPCPSGSCLFGTCEAGADGGRFCADLGGPGAYCLDDLECGSVRCVNGRCLAACAP